QSSRSRDACDSEADADEEASRLVARSAAAATLAIANTPRSDVAKIGSEARPRREMRRWKRRVGRRLRAMESLRALRGMTRRAPSRDPTRAPSRAADIVSGEGRHTRQAGGSRPGDAGRWRVTRGRSKPTTR